MSFPPSSDNSSDERGEGWLLALLIFAAAAPQASCLPFRWNAICIAYASYLKEYRRNIEIEGAPITVSPRTAG